MEFSEVVSHSGNNLLSIKTTGGYESKDSAESPNIDEMDMKMGGYENVETVIRCNSGIKN